MLLLLQEHSLKHLFSRLNELGTFNKLCQFWINSYVKIFTILPHFEKSQSDKKRRKVAVRKFENCTCAFIIIGDFFDLFMDSKI